MAPKNPQSSFIPKRGATRTTKRKPIKQVFLFTIFAYSVTFAALLTAGASYLYKNYTTIVLENEVSALNTEIDTFIVSELSMISEFDLTLQRAADRLANGASIVTVLDALDSATVGSAQVTALDIERSGDQEIVLVADIASQSFDSALFQRTILNTDALLFSEVLIEDVTLSFANNEEVELEGIPTVQIDQPLSFTVTIRVPIESLPYNSTLSVNNQNTL